MNTWHEKLRSVFLCSGWMIPPKKVEKMSPYGWFTQLERILYEMKSDSSAKDVLLQATFV